MHRRLATLRNQNTRCAGDSIVPKWRCNSRKTSCASFFSQPAIAQKVVGQAEHHALVLPNDVGEGGYFTLRRQFGIFLESNCRASRDAHCHLRSQ